MRNLPEIAHPQSRVGDPAKIHVRGFSRATQEQSGSGHFHTFGQPRKDGLNLGQSKHTIDNNLFVTQVKSGNYGHSKKSLSRLSTFDKRGDAPIKENQFKKNCNPCGSLYHRESNSQTPNGERESSANQNANTDFNKIIDSIRERLISQSEQVKSFIAENDPENKGFINRTALQKFISTLTNATVSNEIIDRLLQKSSVSENTLIDSQQFLNKFTDHSEYVPNKAEVINTVSATTAEQAHKHLKEKVRRRFLDAVEFIPQPNNRRYSQPTLTNRTYSQPTLTKKEFRGVLSEIDIQLTDAEFEKLWTKYDVNNTGAISQHNLLNGLGIKMRDSDSERGSLAEQTVTEDYSPKSNDDENALSQRMKKWINFKFYNRYSNLKREFEKRDKNLSGFVSSNEFMQVLKSHGQPLELKLLPTFLDRCGLKLRKGHVSYREFLAKIDPEKESDSEKVVENFNHNVPTKRQETENGIASTAGDAQTVEKRTAKELSQEIKKLLSTQYHEVERAFVEMDYINSRRLTPHMMHDLLQRFFAEEIARDEIDNLWRKLIKNADGTLDFLEFARHFGYSLRSASFPNAKVVPPSFGDGNFMIKSRKLNCASDIVQDSLRSKIDLQWENLKDQFTLMDPEKTGFIPFEQFKAKIMQLCPGLTYQELDSLTSKLSKTTDGSVAYTELLKPFAKEHWRWKRGHNMNLLLQHIQRDAPTKEQRLSKPTQHDIMSEIKRVMMNDWRGLRRAFRKMDVLNEGRLSFKDFSTILRKANVYLDETDGYSLLNTYDTEMDGKIPYEQFILDTFKPKSQQFAKNIL